MVKIKWVGNMGDVSGYGEASRGYCEGLEEIGADISIHSTNNKYPSEWMMNTLDKPQEGRVEIVHELPFRMAQCYYTVFEFDVAPPKWSNILNNCDLIFTPSEFSRLSLSSIVEDVNKIKVVNHGIGGQYNPLGPRLTLTDKKGNDLPAFKFLYVCEWVKRKRPLDVVKAFKEAFGDSKDVCLILKTYSNVRPIKHLVNKTAGDASVYVMDAFVDDISSLYRSVDCYVSSSACEGWGEPLSEAMKTGLPTIAGANGGNLEFMNDHNSYLIPCREWKPIGFNDMDGLVSPWFKYRPVPLKGLGACMEHVYRHQDEAKEKAKIAREDMKKFTWANAARKMLEYLEEYYDGNKVESK